MARQQKPPRGDPREGFRCDYVAGGQHTEANSSRIDYQYAARRFHREALDLDGASRWAALALASHFGGAS